MHIVDAQRNPDRRRLVPTEQVLKLLADRFGPPSAGAWGMGLGFYGRNFTIGGHRFWFGFHYDPWLKWGFSPFWVQSPVPVDSWDSRATQEGWPLHQRRNPQETLVPLPVPIDASDMSQLILTLADDAEKRLSTQLGATMVAERCQGP
jgi:hypothetical protein